MSRRLITLDESKKIQQEILDKVDSFCSANKLRYSLACGTLLGAVRHKGFIPWDDDIDLMMPRPDYEWFVSHFDIPGHHIVNLALRDDCIENFTKICKDNTVMVDLQMGREIWGINIDLFPIDAAPEGDVKTRYAEIDNVREKAMRICPFYRTAKVGKGALFIKYLLKRIVYFDFRSFRNLKRWLVKEPMNPDYSTSQMLGVYYLNEKERAFLPRDVYEEFTTIPFEGKEYPAISHYDEFLTALFRNYMEFPPVEKRVTHHLYDSFVEE